MTLDLLNRLHKASTMNIRQEKKEDLVGEAASVIKLILLCCGRVIFNENTNDFNFPVELHEHPIFHEIRQKKDPIFPDLIEHLESYLDAIFRGQLVDKLAPAYCMIDLLRLLAEFEQRLSPISPAANFSSPLSSNSNSSFLSPSSPAPSLLLTPESKNGSPVRMSAEGVLTRLSNSSFVAVLTGLLKMERTVIEFRSTGMEKKKSIRSIRYILRLLSLLDTEPFAGDDIMIELSAVMQTILELKGNFIFAASSLASRGSLTSEDYEALKSEISRISIPDLNLSSTATLPGNSTSIEVRNKYMMGDKNQQKIL